MKLKITWMIEKLATVFQLKKKQGGSSKILVDSLKKQITELQSEIAVLRATLRNRL